MTAVKIVTDSGADIPPSVAEQLGIAVVPLAINFAQETLRDGVDIRPRRFYERMVAGEHPSTTQPSPADFEAMYREVAGEGEVVVSCHLSSLLSGTMQSAAIAAREVEASVHVVDSRSASLGLGLLAIEAARMARAGRKAEEIVSTLQKLVRQQSIFFLVDTLEYLQRNGRIGRAQAFVGGMLNIKPLLSLDDGVVVPVERARGRRAAVQRLLARLEQAAAGRRLRVGVMHADAAEEAAALREQLTDRLDVEELFETELGPTVGAHVGPGAMGVVFYPVP